MEFDREAAISWYRRNRARSQALFDLLTDDAYYSQPIALRHPIVFYAGHLPAFSFNTLAKRGLGGASIDERLETLFARGIDPDTDTASPDSPDHPRTEEVARTLRQSSRVPGGGRSCAAGSRCPVALAEPRRGRPLHRRGGPACARRARQCGPRCARSPAARSGRSGVHHSRTRSDASGDAAVYVAPVAVRPEAAARQATCRWLPAAHQ